MNQAHTFLIDKDGERFLVSIKGNSFEQALRKLEIVVNPPFRIAHSGSSLLSDAGTKAIESFDKQSRASEVRTLYAALFTDGTFPSMPAEISDSWYRRQPVEVVIRDNRIVGILTKSVAFEPRSPVTRWRSLSHVAIFLNDSSSKVSDMVTHAVLDPIIVQSGVDISVDIDQPRLGLIGTTLPALDLMDHDEWSTEQARQW